MIERFSRSPYRFQSNIFSHVSGESDSGVLTAHTAAEYIKLRTRRSGMHWVATDDRLDGDCSICQQWQKSTVVLTLAASKITDKHVDSFLAVWRSHCNIAYGLTTVSRHREYWWAPDGKFGVENFERQVRSSKAIAPQFCTTRLTS